MAQLAHHRHLPIFLLFLTFISCQASAQPYKSLVAPITKHTASSLYSLTLNFNKRYLIDIDAPLSSYRCPSRYRPVGCTIAECSKARAYISPKCPPTKNNTTRGQCDCTVTLVNPITKSCALAPLTYTDLIISWTNGRNPIVAINFNHLYVSCAPKTLLRSLPTGVIGTVGLSRAPLSLSTQFTPISLGLSQKFALCLPSTSMAPGVTFFGDGPYYLLPPTQLDVTRFLQYTPLLKKVNSPEYYIDVKAIAINGKATDLKAGALDIDRLGHGGVKLSTIAPYTILRGDIYKSVISSFAKATNRIPRAKKVKPFELCIKTGAIGSTRTGLPVPQIDLELSNGKNWTIFGANSMKYVSDDVACLAFVNGGMKAERALVIGSHQMEDNFLLFDLGGSRLGFSSSLLFFRTTCGNFNFTTGV